MKTRHNKKRNTAFVYEALIREGTSAILQKDEARCNKIVAIITIPIPIILNHKTPFFSIKLPNLLPNNEVK